MNDFASILHFITIAISAGLSSITVGWGEGLISKAGILAMNLQPRAYREILKANILGMALTETAAILSGGMVIMLITTKINTENMLYSGIAKLGIACAIGLTSGIIGYISHMPAKTAAHAIARQPFFSTQITNIMLITLSLIQTPIIFGFIISLFIYSKVAFVSSLPDGLRLLSGGLCLGVGSIGPAIGLALFAQQSCKALGFNRNSYQRILSFTILSEAIIETPIIFALLISLILVSSTTIASTDLLRGIGLLAAGICTGICTFGPGISSGRTAARACNEIAFQPELFPLLSRVSIIAQGMLETFAIYGLLVSLMLIFFIR